MFVVTSENTNNLNTNLIQINSMWLTNSSIGRKVIMSVTGIALILFLTFHGCMNLVALFSKEGYNMVCEMLGANWYAVAATIGLRCTCSHPLYLCDYPYASKP